MGGWIACDEAGVCGIYILSGEGILPTKWIRFHFDLINFFRIKFDMKTWLINIFV